MKTVTGDRNLGEVETALREHPSIDECVVLVREMEPAGQELVAYVVPKGPFAPEKLHAHLQAILPADLIPRAFIPISNLPLTASGQIDEPALTRLEVIDADLVEHWEERLRAMPEIEEAVVVVREQAEPLPRLHLADLFPGWKSASTARNGETTAASIPSTAAQENPKSKPLAISQGRPLREERGRPTTLPEALQRATLQDPPKGLVYIQADGSEICQSYGALREDAERILGGLRKLGARAGAKVLFQLELTQDFLPAFWGCVLGGMVPVPISIAPTYEQLNSTLSKLHNAWQMLDRPVVLAGKDLAPALRSLNRLLPAADFQVETLDDLRGGQPDSNWHLSQPDDLALLLLTSGSTGPPKGVPLSHRNLLSMAAGTAQISNFTSHDVTLNWMPLDHVGAISFLSCMATYLGCQQIHALARTVLEDPLRWINWIDRYRATISWAPNFAFNLINDRAEEIARRHWDLSSMRFLVSAGEAVVAKTARRFLQLFRPHGLAPTALHPAFGMSETCSGISWSESFSLETSSDQQSFVDVGPPIPGAALRIVNDKDQIVEEGTIGHLQLKGPSVMVGYYQNPEANKEAFTLDGWFRTGDLGFLDHGLLTLTGRGKDVIIINGINYYSHEIEAVVEEVKGVETSYTAACAVREPSSIVDKLAIFFHAPLAKDGQLVDLLSEIRGRVARTIGVNPDYLIPVDKEAVPKTEIGKIQRGQLRKRFEAGEFDSIRRQVDILYGNANTLPDWFFRKIWRAKEPRPLLAAPQANLSLVFVDGLGLGTALCSALVERGQRCVAVEPGTDFAKLDPDHYRINPSNPEHYRQLIKSLAEGSRHIDQILHLWTYDRRGAQVDALDEIDRAHERAHYSLLFLIQALAEVQDPEHSVCLLAVSSFAQGTSADDNIALDRAAIPAVVRTASLEMSFLDGRHIDLPIESAEVNAARLLSELETRGDREVAYRNGWRLIPRLEKVDLRPDQTRELPFRAGAVYLVSGGLGGIGFEVARYLLEKHHVRLLLVGRSALPDRRTWETLAGKEDLVSRQVEAYRRLERLGEVRYEPVDICDVDRLRQAVDRARADWGGELAGVIHLAGAYHDRLLAEETRDSFAAILRPKVLGSWALHQLVKDRPGALFVSFSSAVSFFGGAMVGAYAAANRFLEAFAHFQRHCSLRSYCFSWTTWHEIGMSHGYSSKAPLRARGLLDLSVEQGLHSFLVGLYHDRPCLMIGLEGSNPFVRRHMEEKSCQVQRLTAIVTCEPPHSSLSCLQAPQIRDRFGTSSSCEVFPILDMPRTSTGAIDRHRLAAVARPGARASAERVEPRTEEERRIAEIWRQLLGVAEIGIHDNFFELGGQSLLANRTLNQVREAFQVELPVRVLFEAPTVAGLARRVEAARQDARQPQAPPLKRVSRNGELPLSFAQQRLWFVEQLEPAAAAYITPSAFRLRGALDVIAMERALGEVIRRHEALRTSFPSVEGRPVQRIAPAGDWRLSVEDLSGQPRQEREAEALRRANAEAQRPFKLASGPLFRAKLLRLGDHDHMLVVTMHHIVSDGSSLNVFSRELAALYEAFSAGKPSPLPELPIQYADYAVWQRNWLRGEVLQTQLSYWKEHLRGIPQRLELPTDRPRLPVQSYRGSHQLFVLPRHLSARLKALSQEEGATLFMSLIAAFQTLLSRYAHQEQFIVSTVMANRSQRETEPLIGCLFNILLLHANLTGNPRFRELLARVRGDALAAYAHQNLPFEQLVEELRPERDLAANPLTQVMFVLLNAPVDHLELAGLKTSSVDVEDAATQYDIVLHMWEKGEQLAGMVHYSTDLFDASTIARMLGHFQSLLEGIIASPEQRLSELPLLSEAERHQLLVEWNNTRRDYPGDRCLHQLFEEQVTRTPETVAVVFEGRQISYGELNRWANQLAHYLRKRGVGPDVLVGLCVERSLEMMVGLLGILKAGGAYVPLDPAYPKERLAFMLEDAQVPVLLTQHQLLEGLPEEKPEAVCLDSDWEILARESQANPGCLARSDHLAYTIYTSGSTGKPKGVEIPHGAVVNFLTSMRREPGLTDRDTLVAVTTLSFDIAGLELYLPLTVGGRLVIASREIASDGCRLRTLMNEVGATAMQATPATWRLLLEAGWQGNPQLRILCGGEALPRALANQLLERCGSLWNMYGPTETTIWSTIKKIDSDEGPIYLGQPIANTQVYILDRHLNLLPVGVPGELHIGGGGLARGYRNRPQLTAEKFIKDPFRDEPGARLYKTGDLVRYRADGNIEYLGRLDHQVKIRGFRIELGEIESALGSYPGVWESVVLGREDVPGEKRLVAYLAADPQKELPIPELRRFLKEKLPDNMIPSAFLRLEAFPRLPNGKVDRKMLPTPEPNRLELAEVFVAPKTHDEKALASIWAGILGLERVGTDDNFFELGGHSLLAARVIHQIREEFQVELPLRALFEAPTLAELSKRLQAAADGRDARPTGGVGVPLQPVPRDGELPLSFAQQRLWFIDQLEPGGAAYNIPTAYYLSGSLDVAVLERALEEVLRRHEVLRTSIGSQAGRPVQIIAPPGPWTLAVEDLSSLPDSERQAEAQRRANIEAQGPFDLARGPLFRATLLRLGPSDHVLLVTMHHVVCDGWSLGVFSRELSALYEAFRAGRPSPLSDLSVQYADYAAWQRRWLGEEVLHGQLSYWKEHLEGVPRLLELPADRPRPHVQSYRGAHQRFALPRELSEKLQGLSRAQGVTLFITLLAAFKVLLSRFCGQERFIVSTGMANRERPETMGLIGCLINILPLPADLTGNPTFQELLGRVREVALGAYAHQDVPFEKLVEELAPERDLSYHPLTQIMFVLLSAPLDYLELPGLRVRPLEVESTSTPYDVVLHMWDTADGLAGMLHYSTDLFDGTTITRIMTHFRKLLESIVAEPQSRVLDLPLIPDALAHQMLVNWNDTRWGFPGDQCLHELFENRSQEAPESVAVVFGTGRLTYGELERLANQLGHYLRRLGVGPDVLVGLCVERSLEMVVGILGIMKAGGAYLPLDPNYPQERLNFMVQDTRTAMVLTQQRLRAGLGELPTRIISLDAQWPEIAQESDEKPESGVGPLNLSYVIFTSGSTGTPKGIAIQHRGVLNNILDLNWRHALGPADRVICLSSLSFDMCVYEVFGMLEAGGAIVMPQPADLHEPARWAELVREHQVSVWNSAPALLQMLVDYVADRPELWPQHLRLAILGGDWVPVTMPDRLKAMAPGVRFIVLGGATEASIHSIIYPVEKTDLNWKSIPYGKPQYNQKAYILNPRLQPVPIGVAGELYLGGIGLGRGYFGRPSQTAERFLPNPHATEPGERIYRTGDVARYGPDGIIELIGRADLQVKLRGLRIECGEIEAVLRLHPGVSEAVVAAKEYGADKRLVAYLRPDPQTALPVCQLLRFEKEGFPAGLHRGELPNGMTVVYRNKMETEFGYKEIFEDQGYLRNGVRLRDRACVFDVGANVGLFALHVGRLCTNPLIYAFEPIPAIFDVLRINTALYGLNIRLFNCGLSRDSSEETFTYFPHLSLISGRFVDDAAERATVKSFLLHQQQLGASDRLLDELLEERLRSERIKCPMKTLSQVIRDNDIQRIDLLKIDVEKGELDVLAGIGEQDWPKIRQLVVEVYETKGRTAYVTNLLRKLGYVVTVEQDPILQDTPYRNLYAVRSDDGEGFASAVDRQTNQEEPTLWSNPERLVSDVRKLVKSRLPDYMVPSTFVLLDQLPLSPNGKIDRKALPASDVGHPASDQGYLKPRTQEEEILAGIWARVLGAERLGVLDNFFNLGGHSLLATQVISQIREAFQVELPLRTLFESPTVAELARRIEAACQAGPARQAPPLVPVPRDGALPLSFAQQRLWFIDQFLPGSPSYNIPFAFRLTGKLRADVLERSMGELLRRHEVLRTTFPLLDGQPVQVIALPVAYHLPVVDLGHQAEHDREGEAGRLADAEARLPFDLVRGPLFRASLLRLANEDHLLLITLHHIAADGWSLAVFTRELSALYEAFIAGRPSPLPELPLQYADYAMWQRAWLQGEVLDGQVAYWKSRLAGVPPKLELPADQPRPPVQTLRGARHFFELPEDLGTTARTVSRQEGTTLFMSLLAAFKTFLYAYTDQDDVLVGSPFANRTRVETDGVMGPFVNTLVLRTRLSGDTTFREMLGRVRDTVLRADAHQDLPFEKVVEAVRPARDPSRNPLFQVNFRVMTEPPPLLKLPGLTTCHRISEGVISKFDLALELWALPGRFGGYWEYSTDLFEKDTVVRMAGEFERLLREALGRPDCRLEDLQALREIRAGGRAKGRGPNAGGHPRQKGLREIRRKRVDLPSKAGVPAVNRRTGLEERENR